MTALIKYLNHTDAHFHHHRATVRSACNQTVSKAFYFGLFPLRMIVLGSSMTWLSVPCRICLVSINCPG